MRYVVLGMGAIGGTLAAQLTIAGRPVAGVARGAHLDAIARTGLRLRTPSEDRTVEVDARSLDDLDIRDGDVVVLTVKSQDTHEVLLRLADLAPPTTPIVCAQNGVANEPMALRWFRHVYGCVVMSPALHLEPGVVVAYSEPTVGILDLGAMPSGQDDVSRQVAADFGAAGYSARSVDDIRRWKYAKLITNLGNAVEAVCGPSVRGGPLTERLQQEAREVLAWHRIDFASDEEDKVRRGDHLRLGRIDGAPRPGGSLWQSVTRGKPVTEVDYLCGEIARLAREVGRAAPANETLQDLTRSVAGGRLPVAGTTEDEVLDLIDRLDNPADAFGVSQA